jgi:hypothetical protein
VDEFGPLLFEAPLFQSLVHGSSLRVYSLSFSLVSIRPFQKDNREEEQISTKGPFPVASTVPSMVHHEETDRS